MLADDARPRADDAVVFERVRNRAAGSGSGGGVGTRRSVLRRRGSAKDHGRLFLGEFLKHFLETPQLPVRRGCFSSALVGLGRGIRVSVFGSQHATQRPVGARNHSPRRVTRAIPRRKLGVVLDGQEHAHRILCTPALSQGPRCIEPHQQRVACRLHRTGNADVYVQSAVHACLDDHTVHVGRVQRLGSSGYPGTQFPKDPPRLLFSQPHATSGCDHSGCCFWEPDTRSTAFTPSR